MSTRSFDINVTVGWIKGVQVSQDHIQAVWEAFGLPHQTELQKIVPIFDAQSGNVGMVTWNESFSIQEVVVESEEVECYLEIAFWQYSDPSEDPVAIGFKKLDISDFHKHPTKVLEFPVELDQQSQVATAHIQLSTHEKREPLEAEIQPAEAPAVTESEGAVPQPEPEAFIEPPSAPEPQAAAKQDEEAAHVRAEYAKQQEQLRLIEEEKRLADEQRRRLEEDAARTRADQAAQAAEVARLTQLFETEREARLAAEAAAAQTIQAMQSVSSEFQAIPASTNEIVLLTSSQKAFMFRSLLRQFCGVQLPEEPAQPISRSIGVVEDATTVEQIVSSIIVEGESQNQQEVQTDVQDKLMYEVLAYYVSRLSTGKDLIAAVRAELAKALKKLLRLPDSMAALGYSDLAAAREIAFEAARRRASQKAAATESHGRPVFYFAASQHPLPPVPPDVLVRIVPVRGGSNECMDEGSLNNMISEDVDAGQIPCLLSLNVGMAGHSFCDNFLFLETVSKSFGLVLHIEGSGQFLLATPYAEAEKLLQVFHDQEVAVSVALPLQQLFAFLGCAVPGAVAFLRFPGAEDNAQRNSITDAEALSLYSKFRSVGLAAIRAPMIRKLHEAAYLAESLSKCGCVELLTDVNNLFNIRFHFVAPGTEEQDTLKTNEVNSMLHQMFLKGLESPTDALNTVSLQSSSSGTQFFEYSLVSTDFDKVQTDSLCALFQRCSQTLQSIIKYSNIMQDAVKQIETLILMPDISKAPLALACFRLVPPLYGTFDRLTESHIKDLNSINNKLIAMLQQEDKAFHGVTINGQNFVIVASDAAMSIVFTEEYIQALVTKLKAVVTKLECDDEILSKIQAEITKRGIEVAEKQIQQSKLAEEQQESLLRLLPVVGSFANWWSPAEKTHHLESFSFDLRTSTLTKQVPGNLKPVQKDSAAEGNHH